MPLKLKSVKLEINAVIVKISVEFEAKPKRQSKPRKTKKKAL